MGLPSITSQDIIHVHFYLEADVNLPLLPLQNRPEPVSCPLPGVGEAELGLTGGWWLFNAAEEIKLLLLLQAL